MSRQDTKLTDGRAFQLRSKRPSARIRARPTPPPTNQPPCPSETAELTGRLRKRSRTPLRAEIKATCGGSGGNPTVALTTTRCDAPQPGTTSTAATTVNATPARIGQIVSTAEPPAAPNCSSIPRPEAT